MSIFKSKSLNIRSDFDKNAKRKINENRILWTPDMKGKTGLKIIYIKSKTEAHTASLKTDYQKREYLGRNACEDIIRYYNWDRVAEQTEAVLSEVCPHP